MIEKAALLQRPILPRVGGAAPAPTRRPGRHALLPFRCQRRQLSVGRIDDERRSLQRRPAIPPLVVVRELDVGRRGRRGRLGAGRHFLRRSPTLRPSGIPCPRDRPVARAASSCRCSRYPADQGGPTAFAAPSISWGLADLVRCTGRGLPRPHTGRPSGRGDERGHAPSRPSARRHVHSRMFRHFNRSRN